MALQEDREWALKRGLDEINKEIEAASKADVACWFPMGTRDERIVRLAAKEAQLLNSRQTSGLWLQICDARHTVAAAVHALQTSSADAS